MSARFDYVAYTLDRGVVRGRVEARTPSEARTEVLHRGLKPLRIEPARRSAALHTLFPSLFGVRTGELVYFCRHVATMLASGGNLLRALEMLQGGSRGSAMRSTLRDIRERLDEGGSLAAALGEHPAVFSSLFVSIVEVGEYTGGLGRSLEQIADMLEKEQEAKQKAIRAMLYPAAIIALSLVTMAVLMTVAVPPMLKVFASIGADVPLITRLMLGLFTQLKERFFLLLAGGLLMAVLLGLLRRVPSVRAWLDAAQLRAPLLGPLIVSSQLSKFSRAVAMLLGAGVPLATALRLAAGGCTNRVLLRAFTEAEESLVSGGGLATALRRSPVFPPTFVELVTMGEESNTLHLTMSDAADVYEKQSEGRLNAMVGVLEPVSTLVVGAIVGLLAFSMFIPIYSSLDVFQ